MEELEFLPWKDVFFTGISDIDEQHKILIGLINDLWRFLKLRNLDGIYDVLKELWDYANYHFSTEEKLMEQNRYPKELLEEHLEEHNSFRNDIKDIYENYFSFSEEERFERIEELLELLKKWVFEHLMYIDKKYIPYLKK